MSKQLEPKKPRPRKNKRLKLTINERDKWRQILAEVDKAEAPVSVLRGLTVNLIDGTQVDIDIQELLAEGILPADLEIEINDKLQKLDDVIENVDFFISVDHVAKAVQPFTDSLLKNL
jgi:hypothetical protein